MLQKKCGKTEQTKKIIINLKKESILNGTIIAENIVCIFCMLIYEIFYCFFCCIKKKMNFTVKIIISRSNYPQLSSNMKICVLVIKEACEPDAN